MTPNEIIRELLDLEREETPISLLSVYKGLPVSYPVKIIASFQGRLLVKSNRFQIACLKLNDSAFIRNENEGIVYKAEVEKLNFRLRQVILKSFRYANPQIGKRDAVRVQVQDDVDVVIENGWGKPFRSKLYDISVSGVAVELQSPGDSLKTGSMVKTALQLPETNQVYTQRLVFNGMVETNRKLGDNHYRIGISTNPDSDAQDLLEQYIEILQAQYLSELQEIFQQELEKESQ